MDYSMILIRCYCLVLIRMNNIQYIITCITYNLNFKSSTSRERCDCYTWCDLFLNLELRKTFYKIPNFFLIKKLSMEKDPLFCIVCNFNNILFSRTQFFLNKIDPVFFYWKFCIGKNINKQLSTWKGGGGTLRTNGTDFFRSYW